MAKKATESKGRKGKRKTSSGTEKAKKSSPKGRATSKSKTASKKASRSAGAAKPRSAKKGAQSAAKPKSAKKTARAAAKPKPAKKGAKRAPKPKAAKKSTKGAAKTKPAKKSTKGTAKKVVRKKKATKPSAKRGGSRAKTKRSKHEALRQRLVEQREEIVGVYNSDLRRGQEAGDEGTEDIVDRANNAYNRELTFSLSDSERQKLLLIEEALNRLNQGRYGMCTHCGQKIAEGRLQVVPWARYCIDCQELQEKGLLEEG